MSRGTRGGYGVVGDDGSLFAEEEEKCVYNDGLYEV